MIINVNESENAPLEFKSFQQSSNREIPLLAIIEQANHSQILSKEELFEAIQDIIDEYLLQFRKDVVNRLKKVLLNAIQNQVIDHYYVNLLPISTDEWEVYVDYDKIRFTWNTKEIEQRKNMNFPIFYNWTWKVD